MNCMLSEGVKIRAQIDNESMRNAMIINGGGSISLLALLPQILKTPLIVGVLITLLLWLIGLTLAVVHSVLRRHCSLTYEQHKMAPPSGKPFLGIHPKAPWVCWFSWRALYYSIAIFLAGGIFMVVFSFYNLDYLML